MPSFPSDLRLARLLRWAGLMVQAMAACFSHSPQIADWIDAQLRAPIDLVRRAVLALILLHAARRIGVDLTPERPRGGVRPANAPRGFARRTIARADATRIVFGSRLRRLARPNPKGDSRESFAALTALLANFDNEIAAMIARLKRGFSRTSPILAIAPPDLIHITRAHAPPIACADSS